MAMMQDGITPLSVSALYGQGAVVKVLLKNRANIEAADKVRVRGGRVLGYGFDLDSFVLLWTLLLVFPKWVCVCKQTRTLASTLKSRVCLPMTQHTHHTHIPRYTAVSSLSFSHTLVQHRNILPPYAW